MERRRGDGRVSMVEIERIVGMFRSLSLFSIFFLLWIDTHNKKIRGGRVKSVMGLLIGCFSVFGLLNYPHPRRVHDLIFNDKETNFEALARNTYMADDSRDPTTCSLYYFALGKVKLVQGLWKQAAWHPEQKVMLKFLGNDFGVDRWKTAALKNAFALLSKQRYGESFFKKEIE